MKRSQRLKPVQQLAEQRRKQAEQALGQAQQRLLAERQSLVQLEEYLADYQRQLLETGQAGVAMEQLQRLQSFKQRLLDALAQQRLQITFCEQAVAQAKIAWMQASGREKAMGSLVDSARQQEQLQADKQLQKQLDEQSQQRLRRTR